MRRISVVSYFLPLLFVASGALAAKPAQSSGGEVRRHPLYPSYLSLALGRVQESHLVVIPQTIDVFLPILSSAKHMLYLPLEIRASDLQVARMEPGVSLQEYRYLSGVGYRLLFDATEAPVYLGGYYKSYREMLGFYLLYEAQIVQISEWGNATANHIFWGSSLGLEYWMRRLGLEIETTNIFSPVEQTYRYGLHEPMVLSRKQAQSYSVRVLWSLLGNLDLYTLFGGTWPGIRFQNTLGLRGFVFKANSFLSGALFDISLGWVGKQDFLLRLGLSIRLNITYAEDAPTYLPIEGRLLHFPVFGEASEGKWRVL